MDLKTKSFLITLWKIIKWVLIFLFFFHIFYLLLLKWANPPITITQMGSFFSGNGLKREYVGIEKISSQAKLAVMASEDQLFPDHNGFDFTSIQKAMKHNRKSRSLRGASTISQQVAKNVFLWQGRSWFRKGLEMYFTFMIELLWGKKRILEVYLNVAEMGEGVFGIEAAARQNFNKPALRLNRQQAAMIATCLPNPKKYKLRPTSKYVLRHYPWVLLQMNNLQSDPDIQDLIR